MNTLIKKHVGQLITYTSIGVIGTAAHYGTLITLVEFGEIHAVTGSTFGFVIGALLNYYLNYKVTFRSQKSHFKAMPQYFLVALSSLFLNSVIMLITTEILLINYILGQIMATGSVLISGFIINSLWTFGGNNGNRL